MRIGATRHPAERDLAARMSFLVHELRNALSCVFVAHSMNKKVPGSSNALLERSLQSLRTLLDRASLELRLHKEPAGGDSRAMSRRVHNRLTRAP